MIGSVKSIFNFPIGNPIAVASQKENSQAGFMKKVVAPAFASLKKTFGNAIASLKYYSVKILSTVFYPVIYIYHLWHQKKPQINKLKANNLQILDSAQFTAPSCLKTEIEEKKYYDKLHPLHSVRNTGKYTSKSHRYYSSLTEKYAYQSFFDFVVPTELKGTKKYDEYTELGKSTAEIKQAITGIENQVQTYQKQLLNDESLSQHKKDYIKYEINDSSYHKAKYTQELQQTQAKLQQALKEIEEILALEPSLGVPIEQDSIEEAKQLKTLEKYKKPEKTVVVKDHILAIISHKDDKGIFNKDSEKKLFTECLESPYIKYVLSAILITISEEKDLVKRKQSLRELGKCFIVMHPYYIVRHLHVLDRRLSSEGKFECQLQNLIDDVKYRVVDQAANEYNNAASTDDRCHDIIELMDLTLALADSNSYLGLDLDHLDYWDIAERPWKIALKKGQECPESVKKHFLRLSDTIKRFVLEINAPEETFIYKKDFMAWCQLKKITEGLTYNTSVKYPEYYSPLLTSDQISGKAPYITEKAAIEVFLKLQYLQRNEAE